MWTINLITCTYTHIHYTYVQCVTKKSTVNHLELSDPQPPKTTQFFTICNTIHIFATGEVRNFKFGTYRLIIISPCLLAPFYNSAPPEVSAKWLKLETSNPVSWLAVYKLYPGPIPQVGIVKVTWSFSNFLCLFSYVVWGLLVKSASVFIIECHSTWCVQDHMTS